MNFTPGSEVSVIAFLIVVAFVILSVLMALKFVTHRRKLLSRAKMNCAMACVGLWLLLSSAFTLSGLPESHPQVGLPLFFGSIFLASLAFALSSLGRAISQGVPLSALVAFQGFRLPLELVLHSWANQGTIPVTMTWTGQNIDIITGVVALIAAPFAGKSRHVAWVANLIGSVLLLNVWRVAILSAPVPFGWHVEPPLLLAMHLPYAWIGSVCVAGALAGHLILTRALLSRPHGSPVATSIA